MEAPRSATAPIVITDLDGTLLRRDEGLLRRVKILTSTRGWCGAGWWRSRENTAPTEARLCSTVRTAVGFQGRPARVQQVGAVVDQGAVQ